MYLVSYRSKQSRDLGVSCGYNQFLCAERVLLSPLSRGIRRLLQQIISFLLSGIKRSLHLHYFVTELPVCFPVGLLTFNGTIIGTTTSTTIEHLAALHLLIRPTTTSIVAPSHLRNIFDVLVYFSSRQEHGIRFLKYLTSVWSSVLSNSDIFDQFVVGLVLCTSTARYSSKYLAKKA